MDRNQNESEAIQQKDTITAPKFNRERVNLESHQLVWLDANINKIDGDASVTLEGLRKIVDYTKVFGNIDECRQFIEQTKQITTFLVCSGQLGQQLVSKIHHIENIWSIYIYYILYFR